MDYVKTLMTVMPNVCRLLRYDYGSPGNTHHNHLSLMVHCFVGFICFLHSQMFIHEIYNTCICANNFE